MKHIMQDNNTGCGLACIAMLTGNSYEDVRDKIIAEGIKKSPEKLYTNFKELVRIGEMFGLKLKYKRKPGQWSDIKGRAIVATDYHANKKYWHWVVFENVEGKKPYIYDPSESKSNNGKKRDLVGKHCGAYLWEVPKQEN
jgi:ABC-type bacteriocin/lantibiotic exporter with double-glycine peptidase domain